MQPSTRLAAVVVMVCANIGVIGLRIAGVSSKYISASRCPSARDTSPS
jgi:hypothetical protein